MIELKTPGAGARLRLSLLTCAAAAALAGPAFAQATAPAESYADEDVDAVVEELVVVAETREQRGAVVGDIPPEIQLGPREIRALGVSSVAELLDALAPQTGSGRGRGGGRPITLVNGQRISSFSEIRDLPPEAILRVDILPEEVALKYGYRADQRVVNFVLRPRFRALTTEAGARVATAGGRETFDANVNALRIQRDTRLQVDLKAARSTPLFESERDIRPADDLVAGAPDEAPYRTLLGESSQASLNAVLTRPLAEGVSGTLNGRLEMTESEGRLGLAAGGLVLPPANPFGLDVLTRQGDTWSAHLGAAANGAVSGWRWSVTANADRSETRTVTERAIDADTLAYRAPDRARSVVTSADAEGLVNGSLFELPAGQVTTAFTLGLETRQFESESIRRGVRRDADLSRDIARAQANLDIPLTRRDVFLGAVGNLSANLNAAVEELSDFGTLTTVGAGINWSPLEDLRIIASVTEEDGAPTIQQLGDPEIETENVRVFDYLTGTTVEVTRAEGGNPFLLADNRRVMKLGVNWKPLDDHDLTLRADYVRTRIRDVIASFPTATAEIERAFPDRFTREAGELVRIDSRPVNFERQDREEVRWGFHYSKPLGPTRPPGGVPRQRAAQGEGSQAPAGPRAGGDGPRRGPGGGGGFRGGGRGAGALQLAVFHTVRLQEEIFIRPGVPVLDLLDGSAVGAGGGQPRHEVEAQAGVSRNGLGARVTARWQSGTEVDGARFGGQDLEFSDLATVNVRLFADLGQQPWARGRPWLRGARATLSVDNLFDARLDVRDADGVTPVSYQPDLVDPLGRTVRISFRKLFF
ncbi:TonB-dependent receptor [Phenylobacterium sp.]|uniref:TonB-dependent receptor n=1 Tax=Phenylobacterium sp. TaxID=1871053 RepID=UPI002FE0B814